MQCNEVPQEPGGPATDTPACPFVLRWADVLARERVELNLADGKQPTALCLSGGGIRSATFCLGVLQALARRELLREFHYLSTVSGGGYIGAWLTHCIAARGSINGSAVIAAETEILAHDGPNEPPELERLRLYTNFLTPRSGFASDDTWAGVMLWLRNTLVNWAVFLPLMLAAAAFPIFYTAVACALQASGKIGLGVAAVLISLGLMCLGVSVHVACLALPSHQFPDETSRQQRPPADQYGLTGWEIFKRIIVWVLLWTFLVPLGLTPWLSLPPAAGPEWAVFWSPQAAFWPPNDTTSAWPLAALPAASFGVSLLVYGIAWLEQPKQGAHRQAFRANFLHWIVSCAISAAILGLGAWLALHRPVLLVVVAGPIWVMAAELLRATVYVALRRGGLRSELDREWLARLSGGKLRIVLGYGAAATATLFLPTLVLDRNQAGAGALASLAGLLGGPVAALLGKTASRQFTYGVKAKTSQRGVPKDWIIGGAIALFIAALFMLLGRLAAEISTALACLAGGGISSLSRLAAEISTALAGLAGGGISSLSRLAAEISVDLADLARDGISLSSWLLAASAFLLVLLAGILAWAVDWAVNLNRFSMHAVYRNRLVRAFLGTSRDHNQRRPDRYTGFDPTDNVRVADTFTARSPKALFPVINVTLNMTSGGNTARVERKGEPFTITPLHCGSAALMRDQQDGASGAYVCTAFFASGDKETGPSDCQKGITLGTAITLSGAAASPNMGYHSSFFTAFVMTLFNVRLGAWLPNPGWIGPNGRPRLDKETAKLSGPIYAIPTMLVYAIPTMLEELAGLSDDCGQYIYLSDGGHFDNLGLYEMLRRRCRLIVVVDAGQDERYAYFDLSHTLQLASIDLGIRVTFRQAIKVGECTLPRCGAFAKIVYPAALGKPEECGDLLYIKPWLPPDAPVELTAFKQIKPSFPHETTANQFFTESDFESYRKLGEYLASNILKQAGNDCAPGLDGLFTALRRLAPLAAPGPALCDAGDPAIARD